MAVRSFKAAQGTAAAGAQPIRIVSWNILADKYSRANSYCNPEHLDWQYRWPLICQQLQSHNPDLLCLQEVQEDVYHQQLEPWLRDRGYSSLYRPRPQAPGSTTVGPMDGVSLHFRDSMFSQQATQSVCFAEYAHQLLPSSCCSKHAAQRVRQQQQQATPRRPPQQQQQRHHQHLQQQQQQQHHEQEQYYPFMQALLQRQEGAIMALLLHKPSQQQLVACSTHLHWNPAFPDVKLAQAAILSHTITAFIEQQQVQAAEHALHSGQPQQQQQRQQHQQQRQQSPQRQQQQQRPQQQPQKQQRQQPLQQAGATQQQQLQQLQLPGSNPHKMPVVVGGDFNATWRKLKDDVWDKGVPKKGHITSGVYELMSGQAVGPTHRDHPGSRDLCQSCSKLGQQEGNVLLGHTFTAGGLQLESSYFAAHGREPALTTRTSTFSGCLDYIWLSKAHFQVQSTLQLPYKEPRRPARPLEVELEPCPNESEPSDHLCVGCDVVLVPAEPAAGGAKQQPEVCLSAV